MRSWDLGAWAAGTWAKKRLQRLELRPRTRSTSSDYWQNSRTMRNWGQAESCQSKCRSALQSIEGAVLEYRNETYGHTIFLSSTWLQPSKGKRPIDLFGSVFFFGRIHQK
jgi:hypothetical protein